MASRRGGETPERRDRRNAGNNAAGQNFVSVAIHNDPMAQIQRSETAAQIAATRKNTNTESLCPLAQNSTTTSGDQR